MIIKVLIKQIIRVIMHELDQSSGRQTLISIEHIGIINLFIYQINQLLTPFLKVKFFHSLINFVLIKV